MKLPTRGWICMLAFAANGIAAQEATPSGDVEQRLRVVERKLELGDAQKAEKEKSTATLAAGADGFTLKSAKGDFQLKMKGYVHIDGRWFLDDGAKPSTDSLLIRRARPILEGTLYRSFDFRIMPDFGGGTTVLQDAWLEARFAKGFRVRAGKYKPPVGLERLQSATDLAFVERALPTALVPNRDVGIQLGGELAAAKLEYAVGIFNGVVDGAAGDVDSGDAKELAARLVWRPFQPADGSAVRYDLGIGFAASRGDESGSAALPNLPAYKSPGQQSFFSYRSDTTVAGTAFADGRRTRLSPQGWFYAGPFGLLAEWVSSEQRVRRDLATATLESRAWQAQLSWVLTGERNSSKGVVPRHPFDLAEKGRGAWIVSLRASGLEADADAFPLFADEAKSAREASSLGVGLSWNLVRGVRWMLDYDVTRFDGGAATGDRPDEKVVLTRFQVAF